MWLANLLTLSRLPLALAFWWVADRPLAAVAVLALAAVTDVADGRIARWARHRRGVPESARTLGAWLDPVCDKAFVVSALVAVWWRDAAPLGLLAIIGTREILLFVMFVGFEVAPATRHLRYDFRAGLVGKAATVAQFVAIVSAIAGTPDGGVLAGLAGATGLAAALVYLERGRELLRRERERRAWRGHPQRS